MKEMFPCGIFQPPGTKVFGVTDDGIVYGKETIPYEAIDDIVLLTAPSPLTNGVAKMTANGKVFQLVYKFSDRERAPKAISFAKGKIDQAHGVVKDYKYRIVAHTGTTLEVYETYIIINFMRSGATVANIFSGGGTGEKRINFADISAIQFKEPAGVTVGFIQFSYPGSVDAQGNVMAALNNENSVPVSPDNLTEAREIVDFIENKRKEMRTGNSGTTINNVTQLSAADELKKYKDLLDLGVITQEEFDAKKKQLLAL